MGKVINGKKSKKKKIIIAIVIIAIIAGIGFAIKSKMTPPEVVMPQSYTTLEKMDIFEEIKTSGKIQSQESSNVTAVTDGKIIQVNVEEGDTVSKGQVLAVLDSSAIQKEIDTVKKTYETDMKAAKLELTTTKNDYEDAKFNYSIGELSKHDLDKAKNTYLTSKTSYRTKEKSLDLSKQNEALKNCTIVSPASGIITMSKATVGATSAGALFTVEDTDDLMLQAMINEYDINSIKVGQVAVIKTEMTDDVEIKGKVTKVALAAEKTAEGTTATTGKVQFKIEIAIVEKNDKVKIGSNARASVIVNGKKNINGVSIDCLSMDENGNDIVYIPVKDGDKYVTKAIKVKTGMQNDIYTQIVSDELKPGDKILNNGSELTNGQEIVLE